MFIRTFFFLSIYSLSQSEDKKCVSFLSHPRLRISGVCMCVPRRCVTFWHLIFSFCFISLPKVYKKNIYFLHIVKISDHTFRNSSKSHTQTHKKISIFSSLLQHQSWSRLGEFGSRTDIAIPCLCLSTEMLVIIAVLWIDHRPIFTWLAEFRVVLEKFLVAAVKEVNLWIVQIGIWVERTVVISQETWSNGSKAKQREKV